MRLSSSKKEVMVSANIFILVITGLLMLAFAVAYWTQSNIATWAEYFQGEVVEVPYWLALLLTFLLHGVILVLNVISEVLEIIFI